MPEDAGGVRDRLTALPVLCYRNERVEKAFLRREGRYWDQFVMAIHRSEFERI